MSLKLSDFLSYNDIIIQCHDNPDADALASGMALHWYLTQMGKKPRFIYGGHAEVHKSNLVLMKNNLEIPAEHVTELDRHEIIIYVDCQKGESNVTDFEADNYAVIDHHQVLNNLPALSEVRSRYGSCATLMFELIREEGIDVNENEKLATALFYGLMTDTTGFTELQHPADKDLRDSVDYNRSDIILFKNSNISKEELRIAGDALKHASYDDNGTYAIVEAEPCDPNILGIISDMVLEVDTISTCVVYSILNYGVKLSVRSCVKEVRASELAAYIAQGYGGGGGHIVKAGGFLQKDLLTKDNFEYEKVAVKQFMKDRMKEYFDNTEIIYAGKNPIDVSEYTRYVKKDVVVGYVVASELAEAGTRVTIRTLEGDIDITIDDDTYIVIGVDGEIYPVKKAKFEKNYTLCDDEYIYPGDYSPVLFNMGNGERIEILSNAHSCVANGGVGIYAKKIDHRLKIFTTWDHEKYYLGVPGDYQAVREDDLTDTYIIAGNIFYKTYEERN